MITHVRREKRNEAYQMLMDATYQKCVEKERVREAQHRLYTKQGRFDAAMARLDLIEGTVGLRGGTTLGSVIASSQKIGSMALSNKRKLDYACKKLCRAGLGHLVRVLRLIAKNGSNREESIWELMKDDARRRESPTLDTAKRSASSGASKGVKRGSISGQPKKS